MKIILIIQQGYLGDKMRYKNEAFGTLSPSTLLKLVLPLRWHASSVGGRQWVVFARLPLGSSPAVLPLLSISVCMSPGSNDGPSNS